MASTKLGLLDARRWTGGDDDDPMNFQTSAVGPSVSTPVAPVAVVERPAERMQPEKAAYVPIKYKPEPTTLKAYSAEQLREYSDVAAAVGVAPADLQVEEFKTYLISTGMTVFSLKTVVAFMDAKAKAESQGWGWEWRPLRIQDQVQHIGFGTPAQRGWEMMRSRQFGGMNISGDDIRRQADALNRAASDYYRADNAVYSEIVPLHALKKVAKIEKEFKHKVVFAVSDYAPAPAFRVDPFLIAIIPNARVHTGEGRFVIDVWDEPGFGIEQMLKSDI